MPCNCKPACQGQCALEALKTAMFSQPKKDDISATDVHTPDQRTIQHLDKLFNDHAASEILKIGFNDALVTT